PDPPTADAKLSEFCYRAVTAMACAALGQREDARAMADAAEQAAAEAEKSKANLFGVIVPYMQVQMWTRLGEADKARAVAMKNPMLGDRLGELASLSREFHDAGLHEARDAALADATKLALAEKSDTDVAVGLRKVALELIKQDRCAEAQKVIVQMPFEFPRCDALLELARARHAAGDARAAHQALADAIETVDRFSPKYGSTFHVQV